ncbi:sensor histidine kinase [Parapedobacter koreensis]|uniref:Histidine kinase n=1 Tax=Parapedobacter koreensis TaxID=332977 RepID=A0A1H7LL68_9SPHI|nr:histidine kinase [Parapedobacter koreensis]SEK99626.1 Histidine kinase [Parapedobacter koreensis]
MNRKMRFRHAFCWLLYLAYSLIDGSLWGGSTSYYWDFTYWLTQVIQFYFCYLWVFPKFLNKGKPFQLAGGIILALLVFQVVRILLQQVLGTYFFGHGNFSGDNYIARMVSANFYFGTWMIGICGAIYATEQALREEKRNRALREEATKAELAFLKNQINPHFLYNALNYLYSLALPLSDKMAQALVKLSDMMRYTLAEHKDNLVSLEKEIAYINDYMAFMRMRFEPAFFATFEVTGDISNKRITPLLLVPFVENAFKHGQFDQPDHPIEIRLIIECNQLVFGVSNRIFLGQKDSSSGIGLQNVRRRLELLYPGSHKLQITKDSMNYHALLRITLTGTTNQ